MRRLTAVLIFLTTAAAVGGVLYKNVVPQTQIPKEVLPLIRLHVIANSNDTSDQAVKYKVRDAIIAYLTPKYKDVKNLSQARLVIDKEQENFRKIALRVLAENNKNYKVNSFHGRYLFPPRNYGALFLPAGEYEALRIVLGNGDGRNWWCVLYPPLCLIKESGVEPGKMAAAEGGKPKVVVKSKLMEILEAN